MSIAETIHQADEDGDPATTVTSDHHQMQQWSDEEIESLLLTLVLFAFLTIGFYYWILRPILVVAPPQGGGGGVDQELQAQQWRGARQNLGAAAMGGVHRPNNGGIAHGGEEEDGEGGISALISSSSRHPPHLAPPYVPTGSRVLVDGLVPFRSGLACTYEATLQTQLEKLGGDDTSGEESVAMKNRKERARLFARLLSPALSGGASSKPVPPPKGGNVVIVAPASDSKCLKLRKVLFLLGTYYNVFFVAVVPLIGTDEEADEIVRSVRKYLRSSTQSGGTGDGLLPEEVLPSHRIVAVHSVTGRVAFVRQLARVEFILDFDDEVRTQLERFGFRVLIYGDGMSGGEDDRKLGGGERTSMLGSTLFP